MPPTRRADAVSADDSELYVTLCVACFLTPPGSSLPAPQKRMTRLLIALMGA